MKLIKVLKSFAPLLYLWGSQVIVQCYLSIIILTYYKFDSSILKKFWFIENYYDLYIMGGNLKLLIMLLGAITSIFFYILHINREFGKFFFVFL